MTPKTVKYVIGLALANAGIHRFEEAARRLRISRSYFSLILSCERRPARYQKALARLCAKRPEDLFGQFTNPDLKEDVA